mmetsp:Transcript_12033/g.15222  ORF Transcript_12033/g.15222 Transcript_12033/m.15222 type:complete len:1147 (+) Transcript_12033:98-3538(+)
MEDVPQLLDLVSVDGKVLDDEGKNGNKMEELRDAASDVTDVSRLGNREDNKFGELQDNLKEGGLNTNDTLGELEENTADAISGNIEQRKYSESGFGEFQGDPADNLNTKKADVLGNVVDAVSSGNTAQKEPLREDTQANLVQNDFSAKDLTLISSENFHGNSLSDFSEQISKAAAQTDEPLDSLGYVEANGNGVKLQAEQPQMKKDGDAVDSEQVGEQTFPGNPIMQGNLEQEQDAFRPFNAEDCENISITDSNKDAQSMVIESENHMELDNNGGAGEPQALFLKGSEQQASILEENRELPLKNVDSCGTVKISNLNQSMKQNVISVSEPTNLSDDFETAFNQDSEQNDTLPANKEKTVSVGEIHALQEKQAGSCVGSQEMVQNTLYYPDSVKGNKIRGNQSCDPSHRKDESFRDFDEAFSNSCLIEDSGQGTAILSDENAANKDDLAGQVSNRGVSETKAQTQQQEDKAPAPLGEPDDSYEAATAGTSDQQIIESEGCRIGEACDEFVEIAPGTNEGGRPESQNICPGHASKPEGQDSFESYDSADKITADQQGNSNLASDAIDNCSETKEDSFSRFEEATNEKNAHEESEIEPSTIEEKEGVSDQQIGCEELAKSVEHMNVFAKEQQNTPQTNEDSFGDFKEVTLNQPQCDKERSQCTSERFGDFEAVTTNQSQVEQPAQPASEGCVVLDATAQTKEEGEVLIQNAPAANEDSFGEFEEAVPEAKDHQIGGEGVEAVGSLEEEDADFGDFASSTAKDTTPSPHPGGEGLEAVGSMEGEDNDFEDFESSPAVDNTPSPHPGGEGLEAVVSVEEEEDDFGDFESSPAPDTTPSPHPDELSTASASEQGKHQQPEENDFDNFGDFSSFNETSAPVIDATAIHQEQENEDFGTFADFSSFTPPTEQRIDAKALSPEENSKLLQFNGTYRTVFCKNLLPMAENTPPPEIEASLAFLNSYRAPKSQGKMPCMNPWAQQTLKACIKGPELAKSEMHDGTSLSVEGKGGFDLGVTLAEPKNHSPSFLSRKDHENSPSSQPNHLSAEASQTKLNSTEAKQTSVTRGNSKVSSEKKDAEDTREFSTMTNGESQGPNDSDPTERRRSKSRKRPDLSPAKISESLKTFVDRLPDLSFMLSKGAHNTSANSTQKGTP